MKILGSSTRELLHYHKWLLYRICVLPITLYSFPLQYFKNAPLSYLLKELRKIQWRVAIQIMRAFYILPTLEIEAIASFISIHSHLQKISSRHQLRTVFLPSNYTINLFLKSRHSNKSLPYCLFRENNHQAIAQN